MHFRDLNEAQILALAITAEEEDARIYRDFAESLSSGILAIAVLRPFSDHFLIGGRATEKTKSVLFSCMSENIEAAHQGIALRILRVQFSKKGFLYPAFRLSDYNSGSGIRGARSEFCRHLRSSSSAQPARVTVSDARKTRVSGRCEPSGLAVQETQRPPRARPQAKLCATNVIVFMFVALCLRPNGGGVGRHRRIRLCGPGFDCVGHHGTISLKEIMDHRPAGAHIGGQLSGD